jgi:glycosyltransferase involved in cell wall biosynthesis
VKVIKPLQRAIHPARDWAALRQLKSYLADFKPDVVHTHSAKGGMLGRQAAWDLKVPAIIHSVHGAPFYDYQPAIARTFYRWCEIWAAKRCHRFICVADAMTDLMVKAGVATRDRFTTVYSGMEIEPFVNANLHRQSMRKKLAISDDDIIVGKIARLFDLKGHEFILEIATSVVQACPNVRFLFVGDGLRRTEYEKTIAEQGLEKHFIFAGLVPPEEVPHYIGAMDVLVHTSLREGLARALPQALLAGKPAISYDIDGAREVVLDGKTGYLLPPRSTGPLADSIMRLANDPQLRDQFGAAGRELCVPRFDHHEMTRQIREIYRKTLSENGVSPR